MAKQRVGRKTGGHNGGYFYRKRRGRHALDGRRQVALRFEDGMPIKDTKNPS